MEQTKSTKVEAFIQRYGYSYKSYFIALIIFPPACYLIAWKMEGINNYQRMVLAIVAFAVPTSMVLLGGTALFNLFSA